MREREYRAWDKKQGKMLSYDIDHDVLFVVACNGDVSRAGTSHSYPTEEWDWQCDPEPTDELIVMDYLGLKGKDGVKIYEGDKVLFQMGTGEVIFEFGAFVLATDETNRCSFGLWVDGDVFDGVVVGNIYEDASRDSGLTSKQV